MHFSGIFWIEKSELMLCMLGIMLYIKHVLSYQCIWEAVCGQ